MKKSFAFVLVFAMLFTLAAGSVPFAAGAEDGENGGGTLISLLDFEDASYLANFKAYDPNGDLSDGDYAFGSRNALAEIVQQNGPGTGEYCLRYYDRQTDNERIKLAHVLPESLTEEDIGSTLTISAWVKAGNLTDTSKTASVVMRIMHDKDYNYVASSSTTTLTVGEWVYAEVQLDVTETLLNNVPSGAPLRIAFQTSGGGIPTELYIDDVKVESKRVTLSAANIFTDNMVLQRNKPIPVWGFGQTEGEQVTVAIGSNQKTTTVQDGKWYVELDAMEAQKNLTMTISGTSQTTTFQNVAIGEVWIASGQSNMEFRLGNIVDAEEIIADSANRDIRLFKIPASGSFEPVDDIAKNAWKLADPSTVLNASAIGYIACAEIQKYLTNDIVVGLLENNWGAACGEAYLDLETLESRPEYAEILGVPDDNGIYPDFGDSNVPAKQSLGYYRQKAEAGETVDMKYVPTACYNAMVHPIAPYAVGGIMWYQGEARINSDHAETYNYILYDLIHLWREKFKDDNLPFLIVQLTPYTAEATRDYPAIRQIQFDTHKRVANTALITTANEGPNDYPGEEKIHPLCKVPVGERAGAAAIALKYGGTEEYTGPEYDYMTVEGNKAILHFTHLGAGLQTSDGAALKGFQVSADGTSFVTATANIVGDTIEVTGVDNPKEVRYCYVKHAEGDYSTLGGNLTNDTLVPASPFRASVADVSLAPVLTFDDSGTQIDSVSAEDLANGITVRAMVQNSGFSSSEQKLLVALCNDGELKHVRLFDADIPTIGEAYFDAEFQLAETLSDCKVRLFLWDGMDSINPLVIPSNVPIQ